MKRNFLYIASVIALFSAPLPALAVSSAIMQAVTPTTELDDVQSGNDSNSSLNIVNPIAKPSFAPNNNSAVYCTIKNDSDNDFTLTGASAITIANNTVLHKSYIDEKGIARMVPLKQIVIPAHSEIILAPGGIHVMLTDLKRSLKGGDSFKLDFHFEPIGTRSVEVTVQGLE